MAPFPSSGEFLKIIRAGTAVAGAAIRRLTTKVSKLHPSADASAATGDSKISQCVSCMEDFEKRKLTTLACSHEYCGCCLGQLIKTTLTHPGLFPPRCCAREIPPLLVRRNLSRRKFIDYQALSQEYAIPVPESWYCPYPRCLKLINLKGAPTGSKSSIRCHSCRKHVCTTCRGPAHDQRRLETCPQDIALEATLWASSIYGWKRCFRCGNLIELIGGCPHIICTCGAHFCYQSGLRWKYCRCDKHEQVEQEHAGPVVVDTSAESRIDGGPLQRTPRRTAETVPFRAATEEEQARSSRAAAERSARGRNQARTQAARAPTEQEVRSAQASMQGSSRERNDVQAQASRAVAVLHARMAIAAEESSSRGRDRAPRRVTSAAVR